MTSDFVQDKNAAPSPFDDQEADLILLSSDGVAFHVHSVLLSLVSLVFGTMVKLPQGGSQEFHDGKPSVPLTDTAKKLYLLLTWCDPRCTTRSSDLADLQTVFELADKYGMDNVIKIVTSAILTMKSIIAAEPLRVFAIATRFRLEELAKVAAIEVIKTPCHQWVFCSELRLISGATYHHLLLYQRRCGKAARATAVDLGWIRDLPVWGDTFSEECDDADGECFLEVQDCYLWKGWFLEYMSLVAADLRECPAGDTVQTPGLLEKIHKIISQSSCENCQEFGSQNLHEFMKVLAKRVDENIQKVDFKLEI